MKSKVIYRVDTNGLFLFDWIDVFFPVSFFVLVNFFIIILWFMPRSPPSAW